MKEKKTLVISHNRIGSNNNMGITLDKLLFDFDDDRLCQISFREEDTKRKHSNLILTDRDALKSVIIRTNFWKIGSNKRVKTNENKPDNNRVVKKSLLKLMLRDMIWKISSWKTKNLLKFLEENNIERVIVAPGYSLFIYDIAMYIREYLDVPVISYFADDYYDSIGMSNTIFSNIYQRMLRSKINEIVSVSDQVFCISEPMTKYYSEIFNKPISTMYTPNTTVINTNFSNGQESLKNKEHIVIGYVGNLSLGRFEELLKLTEILKSEFLNKSYELQVYGQLLPEQVKQVPDKFRDVFRGYISPSEVMEVESEFDILLHVESFNPDTIDRVKNSFSTKLTKYLISGKQILLIGPDSVHSISYFIEYNLGYVITDLTENNLISTLENIKNDVSFERIDNAKEIAVKNHTRTFKDYFL